MADISEWSPLDESNTSASPNGWPEFMAVSGINNSGRGMMGAIRRWYDIVVAQVANIEASLANRLPLTGGSLSGEVFSTANISTAAALTAGEGVVSYGYIQAGSSIVGTTIIASGDMTGNSIASASYVNVATHVNASQYRLAGVPIEFGTLFSEVRDLRERVRKLERGR